MDALKIKILTEVVGGHVLGSIINRVDQDDSDILTKKMERVLGVKVLGIIPEDANVRRASSAKVPIVIKFPTSPASIAIKRIASNLVGVAYKDDAVAVKRESFMDRLSKALFKNCLLYTSPSPRD